MPIESEGRDNVRTKRLPNCNSFPIQSNDNGVKFCSVLPEFIVLRFHPSIQPFKLEMNDKPIFCPKDEIKKMTELQCKV